jgi:hypothetical protein
VSNYPINNVHSVVVVPIKSVHGGTRYVARILSKYYRSGAQASAVYTFTQIPTMTREEAIMDLEQKLGYGTYPEVRHA